MWSEFFPLLLLVSELSVAVSDTHVGNIPAGIRVRRRFRRDIEITDVRRKHSGNVVTYHPDNRD
jgi:hypothetical protein